MASYSIDSADIVRVLAREGHAHRCVRCDARMLIKHESSLCVHCFNDLRTSTRADAERAEGKEPGARGARARAELRSAEPSTELEAEEHRTGAPALLA